MPTSNNPSVNKDISLNDIFVWNKNPRFIDIDETTFQNINLGDKKDDAFDIRQLLNYEFSHNRYQDQDDEYIYQHNLNDDYRDFLYLVESLLKDGYKNDDDTIFVKEFSDQKNKYFVLEGNRRISCIKVLLNLQKYDWLEESVKSRVSELIDQYSLETLKKSIPNNEINVKVLSAATNDDEIWHIIYARHNNKKIGKSRWLRIKFLRDVKFHFQKLLKGKNISKNNFDSQEKDLIKHLSYILNKNNASYDLRASLWVTYSLDNTDVYSDKEKKDGKIEISAFEKCFNFNRDPLTDTTRLSDYFAIDYDLYNWKAIVVNQKPDYIEQCDSQKIITFFLQQFKNDSYTTRGWRENKKYILKDFLFPSLSLDKKDTWLDLSANALNNELDNPDSDLLKDYSDDEKDQIKSYLKSLNDSINFFKEINNNLKLIKKIIDGAISNIKPSDKHNNYYSSLALFSSFVDSLLWEKPNDSILNLSTQKLPLAQLGLIVRESINKILFIVFVNPDSRKYLINALNWSGKCTIHGTQNGGVASRASNTVLHDFSNDQRLIDFSQTIERNEYMETIYYKFISMRRADCFVDGLKIGEAFTKFLSSVMSKFNICMQTNSFDDIKNCKLFKDFYTLDSSSIPTSSEYFVKNIYSFVSSFVHWNYYDYKAFNIYDPAKVSYWMKQLKEMYSDLVGFTKLLSKII